MANRWIGVALLGCFLTATGVKAQGPVPSSPMGCGTCGGGAGMPGPPMGYGSCGGGPTMSGPMSSGQAPPGPSDDMSLPGDVPNAFTNEPPCGPCCPRVYADFAYLAWWFKNPSLPPLVTTSAGTAGAASGSLADPTAFPLVTENTLKYRNAFSGGRVTLGYFLDNKQLSAFEASAFIVGQGTVSQTFVSNASGFPTLASPYNNLLAGTPAAFQYASPGSAIGGVQVTSAARLFGGEGNFVCNYPDTCICCVPVPFSLLVGARYLNLDERLNVNGLTQAIPATTVPATYTTSLDSFHTRNNFYGGQIGARIGWSIGPWLIGGQGKIAIGGMDEQVIIAGNTTVNTPGQYPISVPAHLYAVASNSGSFTHNVFAYVPEGEARLGFRFNPHLLGYVAYNFMYISKVARPGDQIDTTIDTRQAPAVTPLAVPTATRPTAVPIAESSFWAQGVNVGFEFTY